MNRAARMRAWYWAHRWSSLVATLFLLVLCLTGLPLVFRDEIGDWLDPVAHPPAVSTQARAADLDRLVDAARGPAGLFPGEIVRWISLEPDRPEIWVALAPSYLADRRLNHVVKFSADTGEVLKVSPSTAAGRPSFTAVMLKLHSELLAGWRGELLLGIMAAMLVVATVSGVVLYGPSMKKLAFGTVRRERARRIRWLDLHNLLGIVTAAWVLVVGATGLLNEIADPMYDRWRAAALDVALRPYSGQPMPVTTSSVQAAADAVAASMPGMRIRSVRYPDGEEGSPQHFLVWAIGSTSLTSRLFQPALVDARTGALVPVPPPPWYLTAVQVSRPLHFGDYGGLPLKIVWTLLDAASIFVLASGLYLWWTRRNAKAGQHAKEGAWRGDETAAALVADPPPQSRGWLARWRMRTWPVPLLLAALSLAGLVAALLSESPTVKGLGVAALAAPLVVAGRFLLR